MIAGFLLIIILLVILVVYESCSASTRKNKTTPHEDTVEDIRARVVAAIEKRYIVPECIKVALAPNYYEATSNEIGFLNYRTYSFNARFIETNRLRTRQIETFEPENILEEISSLGYYKDSITYKLILPEPATEKQLQYIKSLMEKTSYTVEIPVDKLSKTDASGVIDYLLAGGQTPSKDIMEYATELHIRASYCSPDWLIFEKIFYALPDKERIAFFIFCVFRDKYKPACENPNRSPHKGLFTSFADLYCENKRFLDSLEKNYLNNENLDLTYFGKITDEFWGDRDNRQTLAYKTAIAYLENHLETSEIQPFRL